MAKKKNIYLIGPMGAGKTTIGKHLAKISGRVFYDSDMEIERRTGVSINWIFEIEQEEGFRKREAAVIKELTNLDQIILATGGGSIIDVESRNHLATTGIVIYLQVSTPEQLIRTSRYKELRPLLIGKNPEEKLNQLKNERAHFYREIADLTYNTESFRSSLKLARQIWKDVNSLWEVRE